MRLGRSYHMPAFSYRQIAEKRNEICGEINEQNSTQADLVVHKTDNRASDQPSALNAREQKCIGVNEFLAGREFLDERCDRWPEHPEARGHECVHHIEFPDFGAVLEGED